MVLRKRRARARVSQAIDEHTVHCSKQAQNGLVPKQDATPKSQEIAIAVPVNKNVRSNEGIAPLGHSH